MIVKLFCEGYQPAEIKEIRRLPLTIRRIEQILYNNREFVTIDRQFEEVKQINRIKSRIKKSKHSKKDVYDWESLLHNKISVKRVEHSGKIEGSDFKVFIQNIINKADVGNRTRTINPSNT